MTNHQLVSSFVKDNKTSLVVLRIGKHLYSGTAQLNPDDTFSKFLGCEIAEDRALLKYYDTKIKKLKNEIHIIEMFIKNCKDTYGYDETDDTAKIIYKQFTGLNKSLKNLQDKKTAIEEGIEKKIEHFDEAAASRARRKEFAERVKKLREKLGLGR